MSDSFYKRIIEILHTISRGKVATYGPIAALAGNPRGARQVVRVLHGSSVKYNLPWHRVVNAGGMISLPRGAGFEEQRSRLQNEGVVIDDEGFIDMTVYQWHTER